MNFEFKIQNISNIDNLDENKLAITHTFDAEDADLLTRKGKLSVTLAIKTNAIINLNSAVKVFLDTLRESYYRISDETPLSALENAVSQGLRMIYSVKTLDEKHTLGSKELETEISLSTALIWNRVLYTNYYGGGIGYILRGSGIRDISAQNSSLNEIWTNSSILDTEDVIIIGTKEFAKTFPANTIIENFNEIPSLIAESPDRNLISAIFIKLTSAKTDKTAKLANSGLLNNLYQKGGITDKILKIKEILSKTERLSDRFKIYQKKKVAPISSISGIITSAPNLEGPKAGLTTVKRLNRDRNKKSYKKVTTSIIGMVLLSSISIGGYYALTNKKNELQSQVLKYSTIDNTNPQTEKPEIAALTYQDLHQLVKTPENVDFKDFFVKDTNTIIFTNNTKSLQKLAVSENTTTKLYDFENPEYLRCDTKLCYLFDNKSLIVLEPKENPNVDKYLVDKLGTITNIHPYNNKVYLLTNTTLYQQFLQSPEAPDIWIKDNTTFNKPIDLAIDGNVYVLDGGKVIKLYSGRKIADYDFSSRLTDPIDIEVDIKNLYILDRQKRTVYVFNKGTGDFVKEIVLTDEFDSAIPDKIFIYEKANTSTLYFLKNNKLFRVE